MITSNKFKVAEAEQLLSPHGVKIVAIAKKLHEIQTDDSRKLVREKTMQAFRDLKRPLFVEHTGLHLPYLNGLPGGLTQVVWDNLGADRFSALFGKAADPTATAMTIIGYCDAQQIHFFEGAIKGRIADSPRGARDFQWDCVFIPDGSAQTFAEMGAKKNDISMRRQAMDKFIAHLKGGTP